MPLAQLPALLSAWLTDITAALDRRSAPHLLLLFIGALFAQGRRTVTSWFRPAGIRADFRRGYAALWAAGRRADALSYRLLCAVLKQLMRRAGQDPLRFAIDDTPTARYGPRVQGAGIHHNPSPGPAGEKFVYGHVWVCLAWLARHPAWNTLALPLRALLYVRAKDVPKLAKHYSWTFRTKLQLAAELVRWLKVWLCGLDNRLWLAVDGAYAKRPFLKPVLALGVVVFSRLRKDAHLLSLPPIRRRRGQRGIQALNRLREGRPAEAAAELAKAEEQTPDVAGLLNNEAFGHLRDCDDLLAGVLEVMARGKYYWVPLEQIESLAANAPAMPRDLLWLPAHLALRDGPEGDVFLAALYPNLHEHPDDAVKLGGQRTGRAARASQCSVPG
jgi:hypothetical protein